MLGVLFTARNLPGRDGITAFGPRRTCCSCEGGNTKITHLGDVSPSHVG